MVFLWFDDGEPSDRIGAILWSGLSLDLGFSSFFLGDTLLDCHCLHVNSHVRVLLLHALFCVFEFGTLVACLTLRVRALEKTPSHYGRGYWRRV